MALMPSTPSTAHAEALCAVAQCTESIQCCASTDCPSVSSSHSHEHATCFPPPFKSGAISASINAAAGITSECTDQCVVVACSDPSHEALMQNCSCFQEDVPKCSFGTDNPTSGDCQECMVACDWDACDCSAAGFASEMDFIRCCNAYHPPGHVTQNVPDLDPVLNDFLFCSSCEQRGQATTISASTPYMHMNPPYTASSSSSPSPDPTITSQEPPLRSSHYYRQNFTTTSYEQPSPSMTEFSPTLTHVLTSPSLSSLSSPPLSPPQSPPLNLTLPAPSISCHWGSCSETFASLADLVGHVNLDHLNPSTTSSSMSVADRDTCHWKDCTLSPSFVNEGVLTNHLLQDHLGVLMTLPPQIPHLTSIPMSFSFQPSPSPSLSPPATAGTSSTETYACKWHSPACVLIFPSAEVLTAHVASEHIGSGKSRYECLWEGCNRHGELGFTTKQKICRHLQSHTGYKPFECSVCHQTFSEAATLQQHMRRHTKEKPRACDYPGCGKAFATTGALTIHKRTHNGDKPFRCTYCDRTFSESSNFSKHMRTHTGIRPYVCEVEWCAKAFARPDQLNRHMLVHSQKAKKS